jgi:uncharacterized membrane-anchored protein
MRLLVLRQRNTDDIIRVDWAASHQNDTKSGRSNLRSVMQERSQRHYSVRSLAQVKQARTGVNPDFRALLQLRVRFPSDSR